MLAQETALKLNCSDCRLAGYFATLAQVTLLLTCHGKLYIHRVDNHITHTIHPSYCSAGNCRSAYLRLVVHVMPDQSSRCYHAIVRQAKLQQPITSTMEDALRKFG